MQLCKCSLQRFFTIKINVSNVSVTCSVSICKVMSDKYDLGHDPWLHMNSNHGSDESTRFCSMYEIVFNDVQAVDALL